MIPVAPLQAYLRQRARQGCEAVAVPPFRFFLHPIDTTPARNYAIPDRPVEGDLGDSLAELRALFAARDRVPRVEFVQEFAPGLAAALRAAGFAEESRTSCLACTPATRRPVPAVPGLAVRMLTAASSLDEIRENLDTNERGFNADSATPASDADAEQFRAELVEGRAFTARLNGRPAGAGMFGAPFAGVAELVGITTLEPFRRRGGAAALTARAAWVAFEGGMAIAVLSPNDAHGQAARVYTRVGFQPYATRLVYTIPAPVS